MIRAKHSIWLQFFFKIYLRFIFRKNFHKIETVGKVKDQGLPVIVIANHISWWDGFWISRLNQKTFKRKLYIMMLEEYLRKYMFFRKLGVFSIRKKSKSTNESLQYAAEILKNNKNMLLMFPQGEIRSQHSDVIVFEKGLDHILTKAKNPIQILMVANVLDYFSKPKPTLRQYISSPEKTRNFTCKELQDIYNKFYKESIDRQKLLV